jgi:sterol desaturase/sphingolipid hydroxylase (fatty acid hydroxylase superfamily)
LTIEGGAAAVVVLLVVIIAIMERRRPYDRGQRLLREGFWTDAIGYGIVQSLFCAVLIGALIRSLDAYTGWSQQRLLGDWSIVAQVGFFVITHDFYIYWFHRLQHRSPTLWRLHEAHHSVASLDGMASLRSHSLEILINQTIEFAPMVLLGAAPEVPVLKSAISAIWGVYIHANIDVRTGRLQWLINGPEAHRWHHAIDPDARDLNFATKLAIWDRLFGTAWIPAGRKPQAYGLADEVFPNGFLRQQAFAFRPQRKSPEAAPAPRD